MKCEDCILNPICLTICGNIKLTYNKILELIENKRTLKRLIQTGSDEFKFDEIIISITYFGKASHYSLNHVKFTKDNKVHREDGPAILYQDGSVSWKQNNLFHRDGGPAVINEVGLYWYQHGKLHREDGPAVIYKDGTKLWWENGSLIKPNYQ